MAVICGLWRCYREEYAIALLVIATAATATATLTRTASKNTARNSGRKIQQSPSAGACPQPSHGWPHGAPRGSVIRLKSGHGRVLQFGVSAAVQPHAARDQPPGQLVWCVRSPVPLVYFPPQIRALMCWHSAQCC